jgi:hypothetical protein
MLQKPAGTTAARTAAQRRINGGMLAPRTFSRRTRLRFAADRRAELARHLGRAPSYAERILIDRIIANEWDLRRLDAKLDAGEELSGHALRARLAMENRLRLDLRELGLRGKDATGPSLAEYLAQKGEAGAAA